MDQAMLLEYAMNAAWQVPLVAGGAWVMLRVLRTRPEVQHGVWLGVLGLAVALPMAGGRPLGVSRMAGQERMAGREGSAAVPQVLGMSAERAAAGGSLVGMQADVRAGLGTGEVEGGRARMAAGRGGVSGRRRIVLSERATHWAVRLYVGAMLLAGARLLRGWMAARAMVRAATVVADGACDAVLLRRCSAAMGVEAPELRRSESVRTPAIVGVWRPVLLLPESWSGCTEEEARAMLAHELAHVRRHDYLLQLVSEAVAIPVAWHPAVWAIRARLRQTREMACDAAAARELRSATRYARCLLQLAGRVRAEGAGARGLAMTLFGKGVLEERVMRLLMQETVGAGGRRSVPRMAGGAMTAAATVLMAGSLHMQPTMAGGTVRLAMVKVRTADAPAAGPKVTTGQKNGVRGGRRERTAEAGTRGLVMPQVAVPVTTPITIRAMGMIPVRLTMRAPVVTAPFEMAVATPMELPVAVQAPVPPISDAVGRAAMTEEERSKLREEMRVQGEAIRKAMEAQAASVRRMTERPEFQRQIEAAKAQGDAARARMSSPEFHQQMEEAKRQGMIAAEQMKRPEFQQQMEAAKAQGEAARAWMNSPEFQQQMEEAKRQGMMATEQMKSPELQRQMQKAAEQMKKAAEVMQRQHEMWDAEAK